MRRVTVNVSEDAVTAFDITALITVLVATLDEPGSGDWLVAVERPVVRLR